MGTHSLQQNDRHDKGYNHYSMYACHVYVQQTGNTRTHCIHKYTKQLCKALWCATNGHTYPVDWATCLPLGVNPPEAGLVTCRNHANGVGTKVTSGIHNHKLFKTTYANKHAQFYPSIETATSN